MSDQWVKLKEWPELILERLQDAGVARITLNRPEKRNCWNRPLCLAFIESLEIVRGDKELKVVITKGAGPVYSSGSISPSCAKFRMDRCSTGTDPISPFRSPRWCATSRAS